MRRISKSMRITIALLLILLISLKSTAVPIEEPIVWLFTDKVVYTTGEPIIMTLKVFNYSEKDIIFHFNTSQRYDFFIYDQERNRVWTWSDDRFFLQVLGTETLEAETGTLVYQETFKGKLAPGSYLILGIIVAQNKPCGNIAIITVES